MGSVGQIRQTRVKLLWRGGRHAGAGAPRKLRESTTTGRYGSALDGTENPAISQVSASFLGFGTLPRLLCKQGAVGSSPITSTSDFGSFGLPGVVGSGSTPRNSARFGALVRVGPATLSEWAGSAIATRARRWTPHARARGVGTWLIGDSTRSFGPTSRSSPSSRSASVPSRPCCGPCCRRGVRTGSSSSARS